MKLHNHGTILDPRLASRLYSEHKNRFESLAPRDASRSAGDEQQARQPKGFAFSLGKLGVRYEEQDPEFDTQQLAKMALERVEREREAAFRAEMEVASLRSAISAPLDAEEPLALPGNEPSRHLQNKAQRAYEAHERSHQNAPFRPGLFIGRV